ncbi:MAG: hypothetical protein ACMG6E_02740, partial [Candidatus Roizmanbacteria bacterium]
SLSNRHINILFSIPGLESDDELKAWLGAAMNSYDSGWYAKALKYIDMSLDKSPDLEPYLSYYKKTCKRVLSIPLHEDEIKCEHRRRSLTSVMKFFPQLIRRLIGAIWRKDLLTLRCKWCGRHMIYINPNDNSLGFIARGVNSCKNCGMSYPMPTWMWDSPDGRAYSYYRQSFPLGEGGKQFYDEFLEDYNPKPTVEESGLFSKK